MIEVRGRDVLTESYRVETEVDGRRVTAFVPERHFRDARGPERPSHQQAYEGIAAAKDRIERAIAALARGAAPRAPFDDITLEKEDA